MTSCSSVGASSCYGAEPILLRVFGNGSETYYSEYLVAFAFFVVLWMPYSLIGTALSLAELVRKAPVIPRIQSQRPTLFSVLLLAGVAIHLTVVYGNGPGRVAETLGNEAASYPSAFDFEGEDGGKAKIERLKQCAVVVYFDNSQTVRTGSIEAEMRGLADATGWTVRPPDSDQLESGQLVPALVAVKENAELRIDAREMGIRLSIEVCREFERTGDEYASPHPESAEEPYDFRFQDMAEPFKGYNQRMGLDQTLYTIAGVEIAGVILFNWLLYRWRRLRSKAEIGTLIVAATAAVSPSKSVPRSGSDQPPGL